MTSEIPELKIVKHKCSCRRELFIGVPAVEDVVLDTLGVPVIVQVP